MNDILYPEGASCEVPHPVVPISDQRPDIVKPARMTLPELYKRIREAKNKAEAGAAMRQIIPWSDVPEDVWEKLEDWFPVKR